MTWTKYCKPVSSVVPKQVNSHGYSATMSKFNSWLPEVYTGPTDRLQRYTQYELMANDPDIGTALDIMSVFCTQPDNQTRLPFKIRYKIEPTPQESKILMKYIQKWCDINELPRRIFKMVRSTLMYGDQFFIRCPETRKLFWVDPNFIEKIIVNESMGKEVETYFIKNLDLNLSNLVATNQMSRNTGNPAASQYPQGYTGQTNFSNSVMNSTVQSTIQTGGQTTTPAVPVSAEHVIHISLSEGLDGNWPFGISVLENVFKVFKQKEMLEDALLIYRIHRAPERRIFKIDTGNLPPAKAQQYIERIKYEVQQKRIPNRTGGGANIADASYNPLSSLEDYYFAVTSDGRGSSVDTLKGGENLGEINDMLYFKNNMMRALGIPSSYLPSGPSDGTASPSDGKVGTAFIQEFMFSEKCKRFQRQIIPVLDKEFKHFICESGITIDNDMFEIEFNEPQNFSKYRQIELDAAMINVYNAVAEIPFISKRFAIKRYLGWSEDDILTNERMYIEETMGSKTPSKVGGSSGSIGAGGLNQVGISSSDLSMDAESDMDLGDETGADTSGGESEVSDADIDNFGA